MQDINIKNIYSNEAEAAVLASMIVDSNCIADVISIIDDPTMFYKPEHQVIFEQVIILHTGDSAIDPAIFYNALKASNRIEAAGGYQYLKKMVDVLPTPANAVYYARTVKERYLYRQALKYNGRVKEILDSGEHVSEQISQIQSLAMELSGETEEGGVCTLAEAVGKLEDEGEAESLSTGLNNIDYLIEGFRPGELIILAARPSMGKSALALQLALNRVEAGGSIVYITLEMVSEELAKRALQSRDSTEEFKKVIINQVANTPEKMAAFVKTAKRNNNIEAVFVDYLQLMNTSGKSESRVQEITTISRQLKRLAVNENIPIIALAQLNRQVENRENHRPRLSDLRDSGSIEQDADMVMMLHRQDYYRRNEDPETSDEDGLAELIVTKNRRGQTGKTELIFLDRFVKFGDRVKL